MYNTDIWANSEFQERLDDNQESSSTQKATDTTFTNLCSRQRELLGSEELQPLKAATNSSLQVSLWNQQHRSRVDALTKPYWSSSVVEREGNVQLRLQVRTILRAQANAEWLKRKRREKTKKIPAYLVNPYTYKKDLLGEEYWLVPGTDSSVIYISKKMLVSQSN